MATSEETRLVRRLKIQLACALISLVLGLLTAALPTWIEAGARVAPDAGNGTLEWLASMAFALVSSVFGALAYRSRRTLAAIRGAA